MLSLKRNLSLKSWGSTMYHQHPLDRELPRNDRQTLCSMHAASLPYRQKADTLEKMLPGLHQGRWSRRSWLEHCISWGTSFLKNFLIHFSTFQQLCPTTTSEEVAEWSHGPKAYHFSVFQHMLHMFRVCKVRWRIRVHVPNQANEQWRVYNVYKHSLWLIYLQLFFEVFCNHLVFSWCKDAFCRSCSLKHLVRFSA